MVSLSCARLPLPLACRLGVRTPVLTADAYRPPNRSASSDRPGGCRVPQGPEVVVVNGFGRDCDWVLNIEARPGEEVTVGLQHFAASHRFLREEEAVGVIQGYEHRNRFIAPIVRRGLSWFRCGPSAAREAIAPDRFWPT